MRGVLAPKRDEQAVVYLQECFTLLEEWVAKVRELEQEEATRDHRARGARERSPLKRKEEAKDSRPVPAPENPAQTESSQSARGAPPKAPPVPPQPREKGGDSEASQPVVPAPKPEPALPVEGRELSKVTSQSRAVPRPSQPPGERLRGRSPSLGLFAKKKAEPKKAVEPTSKTEVESPPREVKDCLLYTSPSPRDA